MMKGFVSIGNDAHKQIFYFEISFWLLMFVTNTSISCSHMWNFFKCQPEYRIVITKGWEDGRGYINEG